MTDILGIGPFTTAQARSLGFSRHALLALCGSGDLLRPTRGVYLPAALADQSEARAAAIALTLPPGAAVARETAAWLLGVDVRAPSRWQEPPALECVVPAGAHPLRRPGLRSFVSDLPPDDVKLVGTVPCTVPVRTAVDLARYRPEHQGLAALDAFLFAELVTKDELTAAVRPLAGQRFVARARRVVDLCEPGVESPGESWCRLRLVECGLPRPSVQISLRDERGVEVYRLDMGYRDKRVGFEYDGFEFHHRTAEQLKHDAERRADIERRFGWRTVGFMAGHVFGRRPYVEETAIEMLGVSLEFRRRAWD